MKKKYILYGLLAAFIIAQFFRIDKTNPPLDLQNDFISIVKPDEKTADYLRLACYDCHSHETKYPWYSDIAPVSWWTKGHVDNGRKHLNFSIWGTYPQKKKDHKLEECIEMTEKNWMPLLTYKWLHPGSSLDESERNEMIKFFKSID